MNVRWLLEDDRLSVLRRLYLAVELRLSGRQIGDYLSIVAGSGSTYDGHREYQLSDDARLIDRAASWRLPGNQMVVRQIRQDTSLPVMIVVDGGSGMEVETTGVRKSDIALAAAGSYAFMMSNRRNPVGQLLATGDDTFVYEKSTRSDIDLLRQLGNLVSHEGEKGRRNNFGLTLEKVKTVMPSRGVVVAVGHFNDDGWQRPLGELVVDGYSVVAIQVVDPIEIEFPRELRSITISDPAAPHKQTTISPTESQRRKYVRKQAKKQETRASKFHRLGCDHLVLRTDQGWITPLHDHVVGRPQRLKGMRYA